MELPENMVYDKSAETVFVATPDDVIRFNKAHLRRAKTNLVNAQKRRDTRAVANIQRKIALYKYTIGLAECYKSDVDYTIKKIDEAGKQW